MASSNGGTSSYNSPCAACKFLRRKCMPGCIFAPYFPPEEPQKFANVHKIFGASNVTKLLNELLPHQREDAVNSLAYEAEARVRDPVYGCVGAISFLQRQVDRLQKELDAANADLIRYGGYVAAAATCCNVVVSDSFNNLISHRQSSVNRPVPALDHLNQLSMMNNHYNTTRNLIINQAAGASLGGGGGGGLYQTTPSSTNLSFLLPWTSTSFDNLSTELEDTNIGGAAGGI